MVVQSPVRMRAIVAALAAVVLWLSGCETVDPERDAEAAERVAQGAVTDEALAPEAEETSAVAEMVAAEVAGAESYELDALRIPAGSWDGYAQATGGSFLQCLVARGPREARLAFSIGWPRRLFLQFNGTEWDAAALPDGGSAVVRVDDAAQANVDLASGGGFLWASLGADPGFAAALQDGEELTIAAGPNSIVFPLQGADVAMPALYECLDLQTAAEGDGGFSIYGLELPEDARLRLADAALGLLRESGFTALVPDDGEQTRARYGAGALASASALDGQAELFAALFGARSSARKALVELTNHAARLCRGEVAARLVRMTPLGGRSTSGRSSLLCKDDAGEVALETLAYFDGGHVLALHALTRDVAARSRIEESFEAIVAALQPAS